MSFLPIRQNISLLLGLLAVISRTSASEVLPGLKYYQPAAKLEGKLVFLICRDYTLETNAMNAARIYEMPLLTGKAVSLAEAPRGQLLVSNDGNTFCVVFRPGTVLNNDETSAFVWSKLAHTSHTLKLSGEPETVVVQDGHAVFEIVKNGHAKIFDFQTELGQMRLVRDHAIPRIFDLDSNVALPTFDCTNIVKFYYDRYGETEWVRKLLAYDWIQHSIFRSFDGNYLLFQGSGAPREGRKLITSTDRWPMTLAQDKPDKLKDRKVLKVFPWLGPFSSGAYILHQMSPDLHFALVRLQEATTRKAGEFWGYKNTYFLVDVSNGKTQVLLDDQMEHKTLSSISYLSWIR